MQKLEDHLSSTSELPLVSGRYRLHEKLGVGGMGTVHRTWDERRQRWIALKMMRVSADEQMNALFEREYLTLARLKHPRIIEVYDFDFHGAEAFYTMELLEGIEIRKLSPIPYHEACACLRDVASSLALLHARQLLHRDVTARNVRVSDGRSKLIDFGALADFGSRPSIVGTPTCIAPEAMSHEPLDARYDLFGLGTLAYWLLTGRHAYPARELGDLVTAWQRAPRPPSQVVRSLNRGDLPPLPAALDELVLALLSVDRAARPESAAAVIDKLEAIAGLEPDRDVAITDSYLAIAPLVEREEPLARLIASYRSAAQGACSSIVVSGDVGVGKTRLLEEFALQVRVQGALVARVDAALCTGDGGTARAIVESLFEAAPDVAAGAVSGDAELIPFFAPAVRRYVPQVIPSSRLRAAAAQRIKEQDAVNVFVRSVAKKRPVVVCVDGAEHIDAFSGAVLALLSRASDGALSIVVAESTATSPSHTRGYARMRRTAEILDLDPLTANGESRLLAFLFGEGPQSLRLCEWVHRRSAGRPRDTMALARHLVSSKSVRYVDGAWVLPQELPDDASAYNLRDVWKARLAGLSRDEAELASALAIMPSAWSADVARTFAARLGSSDGTAPLDGLVDKGILVATAGHVRFPFEALRLLAAENLSEAMRSKLHRGAAEALLQSFEHNTTREADAADSTEHLARLEAGWHLIRGDDLARGLPMVVAAARAFTREAVTFESTEFRYLEETLERLPSDRRYDYDRLVLLAPLAVGAYVSDRRLGLRWGETAVEHGARLSGLSSAAALEPYVGRRVACVVGLCGAFVRFLAASRSRRSLSFRDVVLFTLNIVVGLCGAATVCRDVEKAYALTKVLEPLSAFGRFSPGGTAHEYCLRLAQVIGGREAEAWAGWEALLQRLEASGSFRSLSGAARLLLRGGALQCLGALDTFADDPRALERIEALERCEFILHRAGAAQLRAQWHAHRGEMELGRRWEEEVEIHAIQRGTAWQSEVWLAPGLSRTVAKLGDVMGLKRLMELCDSLLPSIPSLEPGALAIRGRYLFLRGELDEARRVLERAVELMPPHAWTGWAAVRGDLAAVLCALGLPEEARRLCLRTLEEMRPEYRRFVHLYQGVEIQLALAESALGLHETAARRLDNLIRDLPDPPTPWTVGYLYEARASVARRAGDTPGFEQCRRSVEHFYGESGSQALLARVDALSSQWDEWRRSAHPPVDSYDTQHVDGPASTVSSSEEDVLTRVDFTAAATFRETTGMSDEPTEPKQRFPSHR
jgi:tetratricopeptide (TPR) repeat protein